MRTASRPTTPARPLAAAAGVRAAPVLFVPLLVVSVLSAGPASASPAVSAAGSSSERFTLIGHQADGGGQQVRAAGVLSARGSAQVTTATPRRSVTRLVFARGSLRLITYPKRRSASAPDPSSCRFTEVVRGDYVVRGGEQQYRHATGSGVYITRIVGHLKQEQGGGCGSQLVRFWQRTDTRGSLRW